MMAVAFNDGPCDHCKQHPLAQGHSPTCPANPAPQGEKQQQEPSSDGQSQSRERLHDCPPTVWDAAGRPIQAKEDRLIEALKTQTKALEEYTKATANLTIHIGLLIQAMAEDQDDDGDGPNLRTLG